MILGDATPKRLLTPQLSRRTSEYSTPRRTSSGLAAVGPSDLLSPTELPPSLSPTPDTEKAAAPPSESQPATALPQSEQDAQPASSEMDSQAAAPLGAMTSSAVTPPRVHEAAEAGGPVGSLVSAQQPAAPHDSPSSLPADSASVSQEGRCHDPAMLSSPSHQLPLVSPAADMASRAYPLPADPLLEGGLSTPQSSGTFDAHIATAPTPYPSLASDCSLPASPASSKGCGGPLPAVLKASLAGKGPSGSPAAGSSPDSKSRFAHEQGASSEVDGTAMDAQHAVQTNAAADDDQAEASSTASQVLTHDDSTAASEQVANSPQDLSLSEVNPNSTSKQNQQAQASSDVSLAGLKLDDADSDQLQLALAISLGQQQAETAQEVAQGVIPHPASVSPESAQVGPASVTDTAKSMSPAPDRQGSDTDGLVNPLPTSVSLEATMAGTQAEALPATPTGSTPTGQHAQSVLAAALPSNATLQAPSQPASGEHEASSSSGAQAGSAQQGRLEEQRLNLLTADADAGKEEGLTGDEQVAQPDGAGGTPQQSSNRAALARVAGELAFLTHKHASGLTTGEVRHFSCIAVAFVMRLT